VTNENEEEPFAIPGGPDGLSREEALAELRKFGDRYPQTRAAIKEITPDEMGALLFIASGPDVIIQAMHYPDSALDLSIIPNIFPSTEPGKVVAGFPDSLVRKLIEKVEKDYDAEYRDYMWQKALGLLMETVVEMIDGGKIQKMNLDDLL